MASCRATVADLHRGHRHAPSGGFVANLVPKVPVSGQTVRQEGCSMEEPIISRSEVCATRSIACSSDALRASRTCQKTIASTFCGDSLTGTVGVLTCCSYRSDSASVTPVLNPRHRSIGDGPLRKATELFCAGTSNCRIWCVASRHGSPAAFLDEGTPVPRRGNLVERDELCR